MENSPVSCPLAIPDETLSAWRDDLLPEDELDTISHHVVTCDACQAQLALFAEVADLLRGQRELEPDERILAGVERRARHSVHLRPVMRPRWWTGLKMLAPVAAVLLLFIYVMHMGLGLPGRGSGKQTATVPVVQPSPTATVTARPTANPTTLYLAAGQTVYALDLTTGAKRWTYATGLPELSGGRDRWISAIAAASGVVYIHNIADNSLYALKASDGSLLWKVSIPQSASWSIFVTPSAIIVASLFHQQPTSVVAVDPQSGKTLWTQSDTGPNALVVGSGVIYESYDDSSPFVGNGEHGGMVQAVNTTTGAVVWQATDHKYFDLALTSNLLYASGDDALHAFDARTGKELWSHSFNDATIASQPHGGSYSVRVTQDGSTLYLANGATVYALNGATHSVIWQVALNGGVIGPMTSGVLCAGSPQTAEGLDPATGAVKWHAPLFNGYRGVTDGGMCYYSGYKISALDAQTGATKWTFNAGSATPRLIAYNGVVYVMAPVLHALTGSDGSILWTLDTHASMPGAMTLG